MTKSLIAAALSVVTMLGCGAGESYDISEEAEDELVYNDDGTFALPESWERVELTAEAPSPSEVIDKGAGSDPRTGTGPTIFAKNVLYTLNLPYATSHFGPIGSIPYTWNLGYKPAGLEVFMCRSTTSFCTSITAAQSGISHFFDGQASNVTFILAYRVNGAGTLSPSAQGMSDQFIINHN
jgi:hypothetical protein